MQHKQQAKCSNRGASNKKKKSPSDALTTMLDDIWVINWIQMGLRAEICDKHTSM